VKKIIFASCFVFLAVSLYAQVQAQAIVEWIRDPENPGADEYLCVFGNTIEDVTLIDGELDLNGKEVMYLNQREETSVNKVFRDEWERLNTRFFSLHILQRRLTYDERIFVHYFIVYVFERAGNKIYIIAST